MTDFPWNTPCEPNELVCSGDWNGEEGVHPTLAVTGSMHLENFQEMQIVEDAMVNEKNISQECDTKLLVKAIERCGKMANKHSLQQGRNFKKEVKKFKMSQCWYRHPGKEELARKGRHRLRTFRGILLWDPFVGYAPQTPR